MLHPELEKEKIQKYPTVKKILRKNYGKAYPELANCSIIAEERGNQCYGFHITLPGSKSPDFFFKIERQEHKQSLQEQEKLSNVRSFMESIYDKARDAEKHGEVPMLDAAKFIRSAADNFEETLSGEGIPVDLVGKRISLQTNLGASKLPLKPLMLEKRSEISYPEKQSSPDAEFERNTRMSIDVNPVSYPSHIVVGMSGALGLLHNAGRGKPFVSRDSEFDRAVGNGSIFIKQYEQFSKISSPTGAQKRVLDLLNGLVNEVQDQTFANFVKFVKDFDQLPKTNSVHHDAHPLNFLQKQAAENKMRIPGEEVIVPIDMDSLSPGARVEDLALLIGQTKIDDKALKPHQKINPMGKYIDKDVTTTIIRGYEEVAEPLTDMEIRHIFNVKEIISACKKLIKIAQILPEQFSAGEFADIDINFRIHKSLQVFEEEKANDISPLVKSARAQIKASQQNLDALDVPITHGQLSRIGQQETPYGRAALGKKHKKLEIPKAIDVLDLAASQKQIKSSATETLFPAIGWVGVVDAQSTQGKSQKISVQTNSLETLEVAEPQQGSWVGIISKESSPGKADL